MEPSLQLAILLLVAGIFVLALELVIPSAGMLFLVAAGCVIGSVVVAFLVDTRYGTGFLFLVMVLSVILPGIGFQLWKRSPIGRRMFLQSPFLEEAPDQQTAASGDHLDSLLGQVGRTLTPLRPAGISEFSGRRVDTVAEGVMIERGEWVKVVHVQGNRVVVRKTEPRGHDFSLLEGNPPPGF